MSVVKILATAARESRAFAKAAGLHCRPGCGHCCTNPRLQTTVAEMMPMAGRLWADGKAVAVLDLLEQRPAVSSCVMYRPDPLDHNRGRCGAYAHRPGICRLFGFCARRDKHGRQELVTCRVIKEHYPRDTARVQEALKGGMAAPLISNHAMHVLAADPHLGRETLPINTALAQAINRIGLRRSAS